MDNTNIQEVISNIKKKKKKVFLRRQIDTIFLMMGNACNLNCRYCLQHPLVDHAIATEINPDIYDFIEQVSRENISVPLQLQFWGGEPLVYFETMKEVVKELLPRRLPVRFSYMTNGKLFTEEVLEWSAENNVSCFVSWDGPHVLQTRGFDAFEKGSRSRELLMKMPHLGVSAVLSAYAYPKEICEAFMELDEEFTKTHNGEHLGMNIDDIFDTGGIPKDLLAYDTERIEKEIHEMAIEFIEDTINGKVPDSHHARNVYMSQKYNCISSFYGGDEETAGQWKSAWCTCSNGYNVLNMGIDGKLYPCHNTSMDMGDIYQGYFRYLTKIINQDGTQVRKLSECKDCLALSYCRGGCKMVKEDARQESYCRLRKATFIPLLEVVQEFGKELNKATAKNENSGGEE